MGFLLWPLLVFAYYKQKNTLKFWVWQFVIFGSVVAVAASGEHVGYIALLQVISLLIFWLSARFTAWCIKRYIKRKKSVQTSKRVLNLRK